MDLLQTVRKEGSRGGRADFKWEDVKNDAQRENYLGHSLMAPVGRWQQGKDLNWYAKGDGTAEGEMTAAEKRKEEIRKIKEAEEEARCIALGLPPPDKNANLIPLGDGKNKMEVDSGKQVVAEDGGRKKKRRHRSRSRDRDEKRHRHKRHRSTSKEEGRRHRRHRSVSREDEGRRRRRSPSRDREREARKSKDRSRSRDRERDGHRRRRGNDGRSRSPYKGDSKSSRRDERSRSPYKGEGKSRRDARSRSPYKGDRKLRYRDDPSRSPDPRRKRRNALDLEPSKAPPETIRISLASPPTQISQANLKNELSQLLVTKDQELKAIIQQISEREYVLKRKIMVQEKKNDALRVGLNMHTRIIDALSRQVDLLGERERDSLRPRKEPGF